MQQIALWLEKLGMSGNGSSGGCEPRRADLNAALGDEVALDAPGIRSILSASAKRIGANSTGQNQVAHMWYC